VLVSAVWMQWTKTHWVSQEQQQQQQQQAQAEAEAL